MPATATTKIDYRSWLIAQGWSRYLTVEELARREQAWIEYRDGLGQIDLFAEVTA